MPKEGDLRIWWIPQVPMKAFYWPVQSVDEAVNLCNLLAEYDKFQFENRVKPDYCNVGGLMIFEDGEWVDWCNDEYMDFNDYWKKTDERSTKDVSS